MDSPLIRDAFDQLLETLDPDREKAGEVYEALRQKLPSPCPNRLLAGEKGAAVEPVAEYAFRIVNR